MSEYRRNVSVCLVCRYWYTGEFCRFCDDRRYEGTPSPSQSFPLVQGGQGRSGKSLVNSVKIIPWAVGAAALWIAIVWVFMWWRT